MQYYRTKHYNMEWPIDSFYEHFLKDGGPQPIIFEYEGAYALMSKSRVQDIYDVYQPLFDETMAMQGRRLSARRNLPELRYWKIRIFWDELTPIKPRAARALIEAHKEKSNEQDNQAGS